MLGYIRSFKKDSAIIEAKETGVKHLDLRLGSAWPELVAFAEKFSFEKTDDHDMIMKQGHAPCVAMLIQLVKKWKASHDGEMPTFKQRPEFDKMFTDMINPYIRMNHNVEDAKDYKYKCHQKDNEFDSYIKTILDHPNCDKVCRDDFWLFAAALKRFAAKEKRLPVSGIVPDMNASTENFLELQHIYANKATQDREIMKNHVIAILQERNLKPTYDEARFLLFCKHIDLQRSV